MLVLGLLLILIQGTVLMAFLPAYLVPNMVVSLVVFLAFYENTAFGAVLAFLLGLQMDAYSGQLLLVGPTAGAYVAVFGLIASLSQRIFVDSAIAVFVVTFIAGVASTIIYTILVYEFNKQGVSLIPLAIPGAFLTACVTPFLFRILRFLFVRKSAGLGSRSRGLAAL